jgi:hypothetical protein
VTELLGVALREHGLPPDAVVLSPPPGPGAPAPPSDAWAIVPYGEQYVVGATGRGTFATYEAVWTVEDAVDLAVRLASSPVPPFDGRLEAAQLEAGTRTAAGILERTEERGGAAGPTGLVPGDLLDAYGAETEHHLFALGTPFDRRSEPPSRVGSPYFAFVVAAALPDTVREGRAAPWFEMPGGGPMVVLDRPIRWYVDQGLLAPLA